MPVSIASSLLLWSALILQGAKAESSHSLSAGLVVSDAIIPATVQSWPLDRSDDWTISEADLEEEESSDGNDEFVIERCRWNPLQAGLSDHSPILGPGQSTFCPSFRSPILRC